MSKNEQEEVNDNFEFLVNNEIEEWIDIYNNNKDENDTWNEIQFINEEYEENLEKILKKNDIDILNNKKFLNEIEMKIEWDIIINGLKNIWECNW